VSAARDIVAHLQVGGWVVLPLLALALLLWFLIGLRWSLVTREVATPRNEVERFSLSRALARHRAAVRTITHVAPLLGLLGTVRGMIATFDAMAIGGGLAPADGVAGGIAEALITTQLGLLVAIPGLVVGRMLDQRERSRRTALGLTPEATS
jgi:biopolymer transport protein ExbB